MNKIELIERLRKEFSTSFTGWDFSYLTDSGRMKETPLPWDYRALVLRLAEGRQVMLDMGTGGGEFLSSLAVRPPKVFATEGYPPNIDIARTCLSPLGIEVRAVGSDNLLPFDDHSFDLVINRHEECSIPEVKRVLQPGGIFLTQQVGGLNDADINSSLGAGHPEYLDWCLLKMVSDLQDGGFQVLDSDEYIGKTRFYDTGALVYYLKCIPWQIEDFSVDRYFQRLELIDRTIRKKGYIDFANHRFYLIATR